jgi:hypothetical protein
MWDRDAGRQREKQRFFYTWRLRDIPRLFFSLSPTLVVSSHCMERWIRKDSICALVIDGPVCGGGGSILLMDKSQGRRSSERNAQIWHFNRLVDPSCLEGSASSVKEGKS